MAGKNSIWLAISLAYSAIAPLLLVITFESITLPCSSISNATEALPKGEGLVGVNILFTLGVVAIFPLASLMLGIPFAAGNNSAVPLIKSSALAFFSCQSKASLSFCALLSALGYIEGLLLHPDMICMAMTATKCLYVMRVLVLVSDL